MQFLSMQMRRSSWNLSIKQLSRQSPKLIKIGRTWSTPRTVVANSLEVMIGLDSSFHVI